MRFKTKILVLLIGLSALLPATPALAASTVCNNNDQTSLQNCLHKNPIIHDLNTIVNVLGGLVGIIVIGSLIFAGIQYSFAGANQQAAVNARNRIISAMIAFGAFLLIYAFVQWLIPGGVFG